MGYLVLKDQRKRLILCNVLRCDYFPVSLNCAAGFFRIVWTENSRNGSHLINRQARIFLSYSSQCETSEMRVSIERPHKKLIIMHIHSIMRIRSSSLDQEADTVWVMSLNFAHLFVMCIHIYNAYSCACANPQEIPIMHL